VIDAMTWDDAMLLLAVTAVVLALTAVRVGRSMRRRRRNVRLPRDRLG
jgi:hypothetical protein